jgi:hypothetical protein
MYIDNDEFEKWMEKLSTKLNEIGKDIKAMTGKNEINILDENEKLLDNQDLAFLLKMSYRTLQRYRTSKKLLYFMIGHKTYYRISDVRTFIRENMELQQYNQFKKATRGYK